MSYQVASPECIIQIFPFDGSTFAFPSSFQRLPNGGLLDCTVSKNIHSANPGTCNFTLMPGGPNGTSQGPSWSEIIVPLSLVMVTMIRGENGNVVFVGIVKSVTETVDWTTNTPNRRTVVKCMDFQYFFTAYNFYTLSFLGTLGSTGINGLPTANPLTTINSGLVSGNPVSIGLDWLTNVMFAALTALGFQINTQAQKNNFILLKNLIVPVFQQFQFPQGTGPSEPYIPLGYGALGTTESSWWSKFTEIFPFPMYEFFLQTVPIKFFNSILSRFQDLINVPTGNTYPLAQSQDIPYLLNMSNENTPLVSLVARKFPMPIPETNTGLVDKKNWDKLAVFYPGQVTGWLLLTNGSSSGSQTTSYGSSSSIYSSHVFTSASQFQTQTELSSILQSSLTFDPDNVKNFYAVQPTFASNVMGDLNGAFNAGYLFALGADLNSIARYGYRPYIFETQWFGIGSPDIAISNHAQFSAKYAGGILGPFFEYMLEIMAAWSSPTPYMAHGTVTDLLRPDILPGNRYIFAPFKENPSELWMFYITGISHHFVFGGQSTTTLDIERGLPVSVYEGTGSPYQTPLYLILTGQMVRRDGKYIQSTNNSGVSTVTGLQTLDINTFIEIRSKFQNYVPFLFNGQYVNAKGVGS